MFPSLQNTPFIFIRHHPTIRRTLARSQVIKLAYSPYVMKKHEFDASLRVELTVPSYRFLSYKCLMHFKLDHFCPHGNVIRPMSSSWRTLIPFYRRRVRDFIRLCYYMNCNYNSNCLFEFDFPSLLSY